MTAALFHALGETAEHPALEVEGLGKQLRPHRHRQFGGGGGRGGAHVGGEIYQGGVGFMPHRRNQRNGAGRRGAHYRFVIEGHQVFHRAAAARHNQKIGPGKLIVGRWAAAELIEAGDRRGNLARRLFALYRHRPEQDPARKAGIETVHNVADHRPGGRGDHPDHLGQEGQFLLAPGLEQAFSLEFLAALFQQRHQCAQAGKLDLLDNDLVARRAGIGGELAGEHHLHPRFGLQPQPRHGGPPDHGIQHGLVILEVKIDMAGGMEFQAGNLAAYPDKTEIILHQTLEGAG